MNYDILTIQALILYIVYMYSKYIVTKDRLKTKTEATNFLKNLGEDFAVCKVRYSVKYETGQWTCYITYTDRSEFFRDVLYG